MNTHHTIHHPHPLLNSYHLAATAGLPTPPPPLPPAPTTMLAQQTPSSLAALAAVSSVTQSLPTTPAGAGSEQIMVSNQLLAQMAGQFLFSLGANPVNSAASPSAAALIPGSTISGISTQQPPLGMSKYSNNQKSTNITTKKAKFQLLKKTLIGNFKKFPSQD